MKSDRELMQQALDAFKSGRAADRAEAMTALRERLAQPEQRPVAWANLNELTEQFNSVNCGTAYRLPDDGLSPLYTSPPQRKPIDDKTLWEMWVESPSDVLRFARAIERAHGIGVEY